MVDSKARRCAADLVGEFRDGLITNREFEGSWPQHDAGDRGLIAIETMLWHYCDDFRGDKLAGRHALEVDGRELFDRCVQFLRTDLEYEWTESDFIMTGRDFENSLARLELSSVDPCWPFTRSRYDEIRRRARNHSR